MQFQRNQFILSLYTDVLANNCSLPLMKICHRAEGVGVTLSEYCFKIPFLSRANWRQFHEGKKKKGIQRLNNNNNNNKYTSLRIPRWVVCNLLQIDEL